VNKTIIILMLLACGKLLSQNIFDYDHSLQYAEHLKNTKQYSLAAQEYERLHFLRPQNDSLKLMLVKTYRQSSMFDDAIKHTELFYPGQVQMPASFAEEYEKSLLLNKSFDKALTFSSQNKNLNTGQKFFFGLNSLMLNGQWKEAEKYSLKKDSLHTLIPPEYVLLLAQAKQSSHKSPGLAMCMSAIIPGAGKVYTNNWKDGIISFVFVGTNAFQAYRGFKKNGTESVYGWIFASVGTGFYLGNLYGSFKAARRFNQKIKNSYIKKVEELFNNIN
jgi:hypothetical protein